MNNPIIPHITLSGTPVETLIANELGVVRAADNLIKALRNARPHGRDFIGRATDMGTLNGQFTDALVMAAGIKLAAEERAEALADMRDRL